MGRVPLTYSGNIIIQAFVSILKLFIYFKSLLIPAILKEVNADQKICLPS